MRSLTVKREKSFVGCLAKMKLYIEDVEGGDTTISEVNCRLLGELKNGEEKSFEITEDSVKIYVIADQLSRGFCNECYELDEGSEDVSLSGRNRFNPLAGNAFRFNGNYSPRAAASRKKSILKGAFVMLGAVAIGLVIGYVGMYAILGGFSSGEKTFTVDEMSITLTEGFEQSSSYAYQGAFSSKDVAVFVSKDSFEYTPSYISALSAKEYAGYIILTNDIDSEVKTEGDMTYFVFSGKDYDGKVHKYYAYTFKTDKALWLVQFAVSENRADKYAKKIDGWAKSIKFD